MHIGVITTSYPRTPDDFSGRFVLELNQWVASQGHTVTVLAAGDGNNIDDSWQSFPVQRVPAPQGLFYAGGAPDMLQSKRFQGYALLFLGRMLSASRHFTQDKHGIIAHWLIPSAMCSVLTAKRKPLWAIAHGGDIHLLKQHGLLNPFLRLLDHSSNMHLNFVSESLRSTIALQSKLGKKIATQSSCQPMGINLPHFRSLMPNGKNTRPHILFIGRLVRIKGVDILLKALSFVREELQVTIAGDGPQKNNLRRLAKKLGLVISWPGYVHGDTKDQLLANADIVVIPSREQEKRSEGLPVVALEALATNSKLLVSKSGGLAEIPSDICLQVTPEDPQALAKAITKAIDMPVPQSSQWLDSQDWRSVAPRILRGMNIVQDLGCGV